MRFDLEGLDVFFPYDYLYKEQYEYMLNLKRAIDDKGHVLLEMPTGTGKTVCLISLITSYQFQYPQTGKLIYCTRTVPEMSKCMEEIKRVIAYRTKMIGPEGGKVLALCLSSRRNMCVHPKVLEEGDRDTVDSLCRNMTASWVRAKALGTNPQQHTADPQSTASGNSTYAGGFELCNFYENYSRDGSNAGKLSPIPPLRQ
jgi:DNA excision repair protein ERCC-2